MVLSIKSNHLVLWFLHCKFKQPLTWLVILVFKLKHQPVSFFYSGFTSRYSPRFLIRLEKWRCVIKPKKFPNVVFYLSLHSLDKLTTFCLLYHGRVIPKSMSTVIVLDDDSRAFNCFREQMVAMIHGVFNNSLFAKVISTVKKRIAIKCICSWTIRCTSRLKFRLKALRNLIRTREIVET